ncbi:MAG: UDP-N-acetylglucosamine 2-epimerase (non-hydrolyzing) [Candidatus Marinimicrobia bacterium]|nr:UDP-N-acetylglucosamine 2-epimerase (non-hydrolyzing) [Candidatus Neomarinimicrobiota bacterium]
MRKIDLIVGVRPDIILAAALEQAFKDYEDTLDLRLICTWQHYDPELSQDLFDQFKLKPYANLDIVRIEGIQNIASIMVAYENQLKLDPPDLVMILGNSDSALACSLVSARLNLKIAHIDSGLRSFDNHLAEEQNDILIDRLSSFLFTGSEEAVINLIREGYDSVNMFESGNVRADAVFKNLGFAEDSTILDRYGLEPSSYIMVTLHHNHILRNSEFVRSFFTMLEELSENIRIYILLHPKTLMVLESMPEIILESTDNLQFMNPQNYLDTLKLLKNTALLVTDSQGLQEESTILGVQCLTLGSITNRPITLARGTNTLVGTDVTGIRTKILSIMDGDRLDGYPIPGWEGKAGQRIAKYLSETLEIVDTDKEL